MVQNRILRNLRDSPSFLDENSAQPSMEFDVEHQIPSAKSGSGPLSASRLTFMPE